MTVKEIIEHVNGKLVCGGEMAKESIVKAAFASDLMSDVLTLDTDQLLLITGLTNLQTIRTAEMSDISIILLVRNKKASAEMLELAKDNDITIVESPLSMYKTCGALSCAGLEAVY
ncbi:DRTGG domain-containing protein [Bacteroidales bacterium]|nr:DRTGG domain-containing protein [Bacteroidales bacterium]